MNPTGKSAARARSPSPSPRGIAGGAIRARVQAQEAVNRKRVEEEQQSALANPRVAGAVQNLTYHQGQVEKHEETLAQLKPAHATYAKEQAQLSAALAKAGNKPERLAELRRKLGDVEMTLDDLDSGIQEAAADRDVEQRQANQSSAEILNAQSFGRSGGTMAPPRLKVTYPATRRQGKDGSQ